MIASPRLAHQLGPRLAPLLARLLAGDPLDRDERGLIVGEVLRLWALDARERDARELELPDPRDLRARRGRTPRAAEPRGGARLGYSSPRSFAAKRAK